MNFEFGNYFKIVICDEKQKNVPLHQTLIVAKSGVGKSLALERGIYSYFKKGFIIICLTDVKNLLELAFMCFSPEIMANYQKIGLNKQDLQPIQMEIKLFHPFTFNIPKDRKIPNFRFFTLPISSLGDSEFRFLIESEEDITTRELLISSANEIERTDSLWDFLLKAEEKIIRRTKEEGSYETRLPDKNNFCLSGISTGSLKNIDEIARIFHRFQMNPFLMPKNFEFNLNIEEELFKNQQEVKIFSTKYIQDQKTKDFVTLILLNQIVQKAEHCKYPILIVLDEIKDIVPSGYSRVGYKGILAKEVAHHLNTTLRANNIASISSSQSFSGISKNLTRSNVFTEVFIGAIDGESDLLSLKQVYNYEKDTIDEIQNLNYNEFLIRGIANMPIDSQSAPFKSLFAPFVHREPYMRFENLYQKYFPERMIDFNELIEKMKSYIKSYIEKGMDIKMKKIRQEEEQREKLRKEKEELIKLKEQITEMKVEKKVSKTEVIKKRNEEIWNLKDELSQLELAKKFNISQSMINIILNKMKKEKGGEQIVSNSI